MDVNVEKYRHRQFKTRFLALILSIWRKEEEVTYLMSAGNK